MSGVGVHRTYAPPRYSLVRSLAIFTVVELSCIVTCPQDAKSRFDFALLGRMSWLGEVTCQDFHLCSCMPSSTLAGSFRPRLVQVYSQL